MTDLFLVAKEYNASVVVSDALYLILYEPYRPPKDSILFIDAYYAAYQRVRKRKWALKEKLVDFDIQDPDVPYKDILELDGCLRGKNTICIHPVYGSFFTVEIIRVNGLDYPKTQRKTVESCGNCGRCIKACPTGALSENGFIRDLCIRELQDKVFVQDEVLASKMGNKVLGCNICQLACPHNKGDFSEPTVDDSFFYDCLKGKKAMDKYVDILGKNYLRPARFLANCLNAYLNAKDYSKYEEAKSLLSFPDERVVLTAKRYLKRVEENAWEWEIKYLITQDDYNKILLEHTAVKQVNHYFGNDEISLYVRIREKDGNYEFTHKIKRSDGFGRIELNKTILKSDLDDYIQNGITAQDFKRVFGIDIPSSLTYLGSLTTYRITYFENDLKIEVDKNEYLDKIDYEIECEVKSKEEYQKADDYLTSAFNVSPSKSKTKRFLEVLQRS